MAPPVGGPPVQLLVYRFDSGTSFDGTLVGAFERLEVDGSVRVLDALFLRRDDDGEIEAVQAAGDGVGSMLVSLLDFRLDPDARRRGTERALSDDEGLAGEDVRALAESLTPGAGLVAVLLEHAWTRTLDDAIERKGGVAVARRFVGADALADVAGDVRSAAGA